MFNFSRFLFSVLFVAMVPVHAQCDELNRFLRDVMAASEGGAPRSAEHTKPMQSIPAATDRLSEKKATLLVEGAQRGEMQSVARTTVSQMTSMVVSAMGFVGIPYHRGGTNAKEGFDCSGFVRAMYEQAFDVMLPRTAGAQARISTQVKKKEMAVGDLVFYNTRRQANSHVGIYVGDGRFIHSPRPGAQVRLERMDLPYWKKRFNGVRRVVNTNDYAETRESGELSIQVSKK